MFKARQVHSSSIERVVETTPPTLAVGRQTQVRWCFDRRRGQHGVERFKQGVGSTPKGGGVDCMTEGSERFPFWCVHIQKDERSSSCCLLHHSRALGVG